MGFFKREETQGLMINKNVNENIIGNDVKKISKSSKTLSLFKEDTIKYVIENFPSMSEEIQRGLLEVSVILENTIDHIEDKSSKLIKDSRNFNLSQEYRDTCISIYEVVENIKGYVKWMKDEGNKEMEIKEDNINENEKEITSQDDIKLKEISENEVNTVNVELEIYKDFSGREPKGFEIDNDIILVDDWDDLLVKTAEILTKQYKQNRNSDILIKPVKVVEKKSPQNEFRDTVIEMLSEYKINLRDFKIIVR
ncbi:hypothetical protein [Clostridium sp. HMSC19A10]|uniref:hypothetical protein n=1 Tax=Clostridium sp. HMSC19A10 TaxID=1581148 RepID=UPI0008A4A41D|nr:hypothetical protein [Clostridium sp. HMSC19A10]OFS23933.1 hypothetical protein HMPREF3070_06900 [Clostridium sp. HMSC19A10]